MLLNFNEWKQDWKKKPVVENEKTTNQHNKAGEFWALLLRFPCGVIQTVDQLVHIVWIKPTVTKSTHIIILQHLSNKSVCFFFSYVCCCWLNGVVCVP